MSTTWLVMLRLIPRIFIGTSIIRQKRKRYSPFEKRNGTGIALSESEKAAAFYGQFTDVFTKSELASYSKTFSVQTLWPTLINFCQTNNMHSGSGIAVKLS